MRVNERPSAVDVVHNPVTPWPAIPLIALWGAALIFSIIAPLLANAGSPIAVPTFTRQDE